jgi:hypothetical protein
LIGKASLRKTMNAWPAPIASALRMASASSSSFVPEWRIRHSGRLAEGEAELDSRDRGDERLVEVLDGLDEVRLPEDQVQLIRLLDRDQLRLHLTLLGRR